MKAKDFILAGLASVLLAACTEDIVTDNLSNLKVEICDGSGSTTRADYSGFPSTSFETGDAIGVYAFDGSSYVYSNVKFIKQSDGSWLPDGATPKFKTDYTYYAYFPWRSTVYSPSTSGTVDDVDTKFSSFISDASNYFWKADQSTKADFTYSNLMIAKGTVTAAPTVKFTMAHKRGLAIVSAANKWYYSDATGTKYTATPVFNGTYVPYDEGGTLYYLVKPDVNTSAFGRTINIPAGEYKSCPIKLTGTPTYTYYVNGSALGLSKPAWLTIVENIVEDEPTEFGVTVTAASSSSYKSDSIATSATETAALKASVAVSNVDLSMVNNDGSTRANGRTTANCYLVHAPGTYKIPLVYGNAIKHGSTNRNAYYTTQTNNTLQNFINHLKAGIYTGNDETDPWIKNHSITITGAKLIWQDVQGMISSVDISGDYLTFTVDPDNIAPGNALIAATTDDDGTERIAWSWHIWVTTETLSDLTTIATGSHNYQMAPVNVGWVYSDRIYNGNTCKIQASSNGVVLTFDVIQPDGSEPWSGFNPYYQWGRKDPLLTGGYGSTTYRPAYTIDGPFSYDYRERNVTIASTIQVPSAQYRSTTTDGPYNTTKYNYWDAERTETTGQTGATIKTIYDPCPPDFCVPAMGCLTYMGLNASYFTYSSRPPGTTWTMGGANLFFPHTGLRAYSDGRNTEQDYGYFWSAAPASAKDGQSLIFHQTEIFFSNNNSRRAVGMAVRPVVEE